MAYLVLMGSKWFLCEDLLEKKSIDCGKCYMYDDIKSVMWRLMNERGWGMMSDPHPIRVFTGGHRGTEILWTGLARRWRPMQLLK